MYVLYKENEIPEIWGVHPQGIETGLAYYKGWNLAKCPVEKLHDYEEFGFIVVPNDIANGLILLDHIDDIDDEYQDDEIKKTITELSENDKQLIEEAKKFINNLENKIITRAKVRSVKDIEDDLVDLKRLIHSLIDFVISDWNAKPKELKEKSELKELMELLTPEIAENIDIMTIMNKDLNKILNIINDEKEIAEIVEKTYLIKKMK
jgi:hypothetical protein